MIKKTTTSKTKSTRKVAVTKAKSTKKQPKKNNFQKWIAFMKKYPPSEIITSGNTILVTARLNGETYVPDRSFSELQDAINNNLLPVLRVITGKIVSYCLLSDYDSTKFVFEMPPSLDISDDSDTLLVDTGKYVYTADKFYKDARSFTSSNVTLDYEHL